MNRLLISQRFWLGTYMIGAGTASMAMTRWLELGALPSALVGILIGTVCGHLVIPTWSYFMRKEIYRRIFKQLFTREL